MKLTDIHFRVNQIVFFYVMTSASDYISLRFIYASNQLPPWYLTYQMIGIIRN